MFKKQWGVKKTGGPFCLFSRFWRYVREGRDVPVKGATCPRRVLCTREVRRTREGRYGPAKGARYPRRALRTREGRYVPAKGAIDTREGRYIPTNGAMYPQRALCTISSPPIPSHLIESHLFNNNFKDSKTLQHQNQTQHKHRARWKKDTSGRRTVKSRSKSKINKS